MKTLHLTNAWHDKSGGIAVFYRALLEAAEREGHFMRLVVPGERTSIEDCGRFGRIYRIEAPRAPLNLDYRLIYPHRYLLPGTALQRILNEEEPDLVEASEKYTMLWLTGLLRTGRLPGVTLRPTTVGMSHERMDENMSAYLTGGAAGRKFANWYMRWLYFPSFDHHLTVSEHTAEELLTASHGHKVRRGIWISPMGVDCERFTPQRRSEAGREALRAITDCPENATILLYAGRLAPEKNLPLLVDTLSLLDPGNYWLAIAGEGIMRERLEEHCRELRVRNVSFLGHVGNRERLADCYANADIFLHPNPREPFGIAPLEAMAAGLALVAPESGGVTSYAGRHNAWLTEPTPDAFARAIREIRSQPEQVRHRTMEARNTAVSHSWPVIASAYLRLYRELDAVRKGHGLRSLLCRFNRRPGQLPATGSDAKSGRRDRSVLSRAPGTRAPDQNWKRQSLQGEGWPRFTWLDRPESRPQTRRAATEVFRTACSRARLATNFRACKEIRVWQGKRPDTKTRLFAGQKSRV